MASRHHAARNRTPKGEPTVLLLPYNQHLLRAVYDVFYRAVHESCTKDYTPEQLEAWAPPFTPQQGEAWHQRLENEYTLVAGLSFDAKDDLGGSLQVVGFGSITSKGHLDMLYVAPQVQGNGIGYELYHSLESVCARDGYDHITTEASLTAKPFFLKQGFTVDEEQQVERRGQKLTNFKMSKKIQAKQSLAQALAAAMAAASAEKEKD